MVEKIWNNIDNKEKSNKEIPNNFPEISFKNWEEKEELSRDAKIERERLSTDVLKTIDNKDFLKISKEVRLPHLTNPSIEYADLSYVNNLNFTFTFDWVFNKDLYFQTTAWQLLPSYIKEVEVDWVVYSRSKKALEWEFFSQDNERLVIREWTNAKILSRRTPAEIEEIEKSIELSMTNYSEKYKEDYELDIITESLKRWIDPELAILTFWEIFKNFPKDMDEKTKNATIEDLFTDFDRIRWIKRSAINEQNWKYDSKLSLFVLFRFLWDNFSEKALSYWVSQQDIDDFNNWSDRYMAMKENAIQNWDSLPDWTFLKWDKLLQNEAFSNRLDKVCNRIWANREDMIKIMKAESWLNSRVINPISNAIWLIQFMPSTAESLWTTVWELRKMTAIEQLDYVERYFLANSNWQKMNTIEKLYQAVFYPLSLTKWPDFVFGSQNWTASLVASQNWVISKYSTRNDWFIDWHCFSKYVQNHVSKFTA